MPKKIGQTLFRKVKCPSCNSEVTIMFREERRHQRYWGICPICKEGIYISKKYNFVYGDYRDCHRQLATIWARKHPWANKKWKKNNPKRWKEIRQKSQHKNQPKRTEKQRERRRKKRFQSSI